LKEDQNTKFFHFTSGSRKNKNYIFSLNFERGFFDVGVTQLGKKYALEHGIQYVKVRPMVI
jgi:hypothetical protein